MNLPPLSPVDRSTAASLPTPLDLAGPPRQRRSITMLILGWLGLGLGLWVALAGVGLTLISVVVMVRAPTADLLAVALVLLLLGLAVVSSAGALLRQSLSQVRSAVPRQS